MSVFRKWIQSLSGSAVSKFQRAASLGVQLSESWVVVSAAAYVWNYSKHLMPQRRQHEIVSSLQAILDALRAVEIPRYVQSNACVLQIYCISPAFDCNSRIL